MVHTAELFSSQIQDVKDRFADTSRELDRDCPNASFKTVASSLLLGAGILFDDADRAQNPYKRSLEEQVDIGHYLSKMVDSWLHIRAFIDYEELTEQVNTLHKTAETIGSAARAVIQQDMSESVYFGPIGASDIIRSGLR